jgi:hypothetical protein
MKSVIALAGGFQNGTRAEQDHLIATLRRTDEEGH